MDFYGTVMSQRSEASDSLRYYFYGIVMLNVVKHLIVLDTIETFEILRFAQNDIFIMTFFYNDIFLQ